MKRKQFSLVGLLALSCAASTTLGPRSRSGYRPTKAEVVAQSFAALESRPVSDAAKLYPDHGVENVRELPMSLTASDGSGLGLRELEARAVIAGPLAFTELRMRFQNPEDRVIEGRFAVTLPPGAAVSRLAMSIDGHWQEAEVVELQAARAAYEDALHRRKDPALLEKAAGNEFTARIFPIPANGTKDIVLSYSQELPAAATAYRLPLRGLPTMDRFSATAFVGGKAVTVTQTNWAPDADFEAPLDTAGAEGVRAGELVVARVKPAVSTAPDTLDGGLLILFDTSASRGSHFQEQVERLVALVGALGGDVHVEVACFDQTVELIYEGDAGKFGQTERDLILARRPLGASDLAGAFAWAGARKHVKRALLIGDGVATAGKTDAGALRDTLATWKRIERLDVILVGGITNGPLVTSLARGALPRDGVVLDGTLAVADLAARLQRATVSGVTVAVKGARWSWPERLDGVQPGDEVLVYAELPVEQGAQGAKGAKGAKQPQDVTVQLGGTLEQTATVTLAAAERPLVERAIAGARIAALEAALDINSSSTAAADAQRRAALRAEIVALSTRQRVLSSYTALLVLETEEDYQRFGIARNGLADIMTVDDKGIAIIERKDPVYAPVASDEPENMNGDEDGNTDKTKQKDVKELEKATTTKSPGGGDDGKDDGPTVNDPEPAKKIAVNDVSEPKPEPVQEPPVMRPPPSPAREPDHDRDAVMDRMDESGDGDESEGHMGMANGSRRGSGASDGVSADAPAEEPEETGAPAYAGRMADVMKLLADGKSEQALVEAVRWRAEQPGDVMALVALGEALEARGSTVLAGRAYGSIIDLFPTRADLRRFAGERLERLAEAGDEVAAALAADSYAVAVAQRPDHATGHRLLAYALLRVGRPADAFNAIEEGATRGYPDGRFAGADRIMREDMGILGAVWIARDAGVRADVERRLAAAGATLPTGPSLRFVLTWETDANDVDFHVRDGKKGHAFYRNPQLPSGGALYADVTTGYGPECFTIEGPPTAYPYKLRIHYYSRGPMGYGMGKVEVMHHDGKGGLTFEERPFVVMNDEAYVDLGVVSK